MRTATRQITLFKGQPRADCVVRHPLVDLRLHTSIDPFGAAVLTGISFATTAVPKKKTDRKLNGYESLIRRFLDGKEEALPIPVDISNLSKFEQDVLNALMKVRWGRTISYRQLATRSGHPGAVRAVASALARNPFPLIIPCHRVIRSDGSIGGFMGKMSGKPIELKRKLLENEGIQIKPSRSR